MTSPRSMFTEAIEDHLALKKQNGQLEAAMPLSRYDVGDPLDRYPGGPVRPATEEPADEASFVDAGEADHAAVAADATQVVEGEFRQPLEPLNGMTPMLSLVEDLDEDDATQSPALATVGSAAVATVEPPAVEAQPAPASVVRFPGGAGPRDGAEADDDGELDETEATGEQPVIVIDADEPLAPMEPQMPRMAESRRRPSFFGLRRKKKDQDEAQGAGWFADGPRDFDWE